MALLNEVPPPLGDPMVNLKTGLMTQPWIDYFSGQSQLAAKAAGRIASVYLTEQGGSISATEIPSGPLSAGLYRVPFYLRLQVVDSFAASITVTLTWTWEGSSRSLTSGTLGANTLAQTISNPQPLIRVDANTLVSYATTAAFGALDGRYALDIGLEEWNA